MESAMSGFYLQTALVALVYMVLAAASTVMAVIMRRKQRHIYMVVGCVLAASSSAMFLICIYWAIKMYHLAQLIML